MLSFLSPIFFYAGISLLIPIIIHLMKHEKALKLIFPTIRFLVKGKVPNKGKRKLRDLLLLLARLLLLIFIILFFTKPQWINKNENLRSSQNTSKIHQAVILLDLSASMNGWNSWDKVKNEIDKIANNDEISEIGLITFGNNQNETILMTSNKNEIVSFVNNTKPSYLKGKFSPEIVSNALNLFKKKSFRHIYIISDFQINNWMIDDIEILNDVNLHLIDTAPKANANVAIIDGASTYLPNNKIHIKATLKNFGINETICKLILQAGDQTVTQSIAVPAMVTQTASFIIKIPSTTNGLLSLNDDDYNIDNKYYIWLGKVPPIKLLTIADFKDTSKQEEFFFIKKAFDVITANKQTDYNIENCDIRKLNDIKFSMFDGFILLGAGDFFDKKTLKKLKEILDLKSVLLFTPGNQPAKLFFELKQNNLMDVQFNKIEKFTKRNPAAIDWINPNSLFGDLYKNTLNPDLFLFPIFKYISIEVGKKTNVLLKFNSNAPAIISQNYTSSIIYATTFAFSTQWSDFQISSSFLPIITEMFSSKNIVQKNYMKKIDCNKFLQSIILNKKLYKKEPINIKPQITVINDIPHEVNVSIQESVIEKQSLGVIRNMLSNSNTNNINTIENNISTISLSKYCLFIATLFLLLEFLIGWWFDKRELKI